MASGLAKKLQRKNLSGIYALQYNIETMRDEAHNIPADNRYREWIYRYLEDDAVALRLGLINTTHIFYVGF